MQNIERKKFRKICLRNFEIFEKQKMHKFFFCKRINAKKTNFLHFIRTECEILGEKINAKFHLKDFSITPETLSTTILKSYFKAI